MVQQWQVRPSESLFHLSIDELFLCRPSAGILSCNWVGDLNDCLVQKTVYSCTSWILSTWHTPRSISEEGISVEKLLLSECHVGKFVGIFLIKSMWEDPYHHGQCHPWACGPGLCKKADYWASMRSQPVSSILPQPLLWSLLLGSCLVFPQ